MLTALDDDNSQIKGFDILADDYITKPFSMPLVLRHIEAVLHRVNMPMPPSSVLRYKSISLDTESYEVFVDNNSISLTAREFDILRVLMENKGRVFSRDSLLNSV